MGFGLLEPDPRNLMSHKILSVENYRSIPDLPPKNTDSNLIFPRKNPPASPRWAFCKKIYKYYRLQKTVSCDFIKWKVISVQVFVHQAGRACFHGALR